MNFSNLVFDDGLEISYEVDKNSNTIVDVDIKTWLEDCEYMDLVRKTSLFEERFHNDFDELRRGVAGDLRKNDAAFLLAYTTISQRCGVESEPKKAAIIINCLNDGGLIAPLNVELSDEEQREIIEKANAYAMSLADCSLDSLFAEYQQRMPQQLYESPNWTFQLHELLEAIDYTVVFTEDALNSKYAGSVRDAAKEQLGLSTDDEIKADSRYVMFNKNAPVFDKLSFACDARYVVEVMDNEIADYVEHDLRNELMHGNIPAPDEGCFYQEYIELGNRLKNGTPYEQDFYIKHKWDFDTIDLIVNHIDEVNMDTIAELNKPQQADKAKIQKVER